MPNARPAFMKKVSIDSGETWRFYPRQSVDTWEIFVDTSSTTLTFNAVTEDWVGEDWNISSGTKTLMAVNTPTAAQLIPITPTLTAESTDGEFAIDMGFKALQVVASAGGSANVYVKAYSKSHGAAGGSGYLTGTPV